MKGTLRTAVIAVRRRANAAVVWIQHGRVRLPVTIVGVAAVIAGVIVVVTMSRGGTRHDVAQPPVPPAPITATTAPNTSAPTATTSSPAADRKRQPRPFRCGHARASGRGQAPVQLCIPAIRVSSQIMQLGLNADRTVEVPPLSRVGEAGWYRYSATPGAVGPTVILGHVDSAQYGDGVFFHLGQLKPGNTVTVSRADGKIATFVITRLQEISKQRFPTDEVYGPTSGPSIRLITCGGSFDASTGSYLDNIIAYGTMRDLRRAT